MKIRGITEWCNLVPPLPSVRAFRGCGMSHPAGSPGLVSFDERHSLRPFLRRAWRNPRVRRDLPEISCRSGGLRTLPLDARPLLCAVRAAWARSASWYSRLSSRPARGSQSRVDERLDARKVSKPEEHRSWPPAISPGKGKGPVPCPPMPAIAKTRRMAGPGDPGRIPHAVATATSGLPGWRKRYRRSFEVGSPHGVHCGVGALPGPRPTDMQARSRGEIDPVFRGDSLCVNY
jgi:hypothetical protein